MGTKGVKIRRLCALCLRRFQMRFELPLVRRRRFGRPHTPLHLSTVVGLTGREVSNRHANAPLGIVGKPDWGLDIPQVTPESPTFETACAIMQTNFVSTRHRISEAMIVIFPKIERPKLIRILQLRRLECPRNKFPSFTFMGAILVIFLWMYEVLCMKF